MTVITHQSTSSRTRHSSPHRSLHRPGPRRRTARAVSTVADLMTVPSVAEPDAPLLEIVYRILSLGQREIVVVNGQRPIGVISRSSLATLADPGDANPPRSTASDLLPSRTARLLPDQDLPTAALRMSVDDVEALPVVDYTGSLIGVLARRHIVDHIAHAPEHNEDIHGPASFPASDPPGTWAGRDVVLR